MLAIPGSAVDNCLVESVDRLGNWGSWHFFGEGIRSSCSHRPWSRRRGRSKGMGEFRPVVLRMLLVFGKLAFSLGQELVPVATLVQFLHDEFSYVFQSRKLAGDTASFYSCCRQSTVQASGLTYITRISQTRVLPWPPACPRGGRLAVPPR